MAQAAEKILSTLAPHLRTVGVALRGAGASLMAYAPPAAADVGAQLEANGARPSVAAGAFVAPTATLIGDVSVGAAAAVNYGAVVEANGARLPIDGYVGNGAVVKSSVGEGALVGPNAVVLGAVESNAVVGAGAIVGAGATVLGNLGPGSLLEPGASVPATELWSGAPAAKVRALDARDLEQATAARTLAAEAAATHRDECAKDYATLLKEDAAWEDSGAQGSFGVHGCLYTLNGDAGDALFKEFLFVTFFSLARFRGICFISSLNNLSFYPFLVVLRRREDLRQS